MNIFIMDKDFEVTLVIDQFKSFIWTERFNSAGDFELVTPITREAVETIKRGAYVYIQESKYLMVVEKISMSSSLQDGAMMTVSGRDISCLIERRLMYNQKRYENANFQSSYLTLLNENAISPSNSKRKIPGLTSKASTDPEVTKVTFTADYWGDNLYTRMVEVCEEKDLGFRVLPGDNKTLIFEFYAGVDRSYRQDKNPYVVFSHDFDNLINSEYLENEENYKTAALVVGQRELIEKTTTDGETGETSTEYVEGCTMWTYIGDSGPSGLERREVLLDASDISNREEPPADSEEEAKPIPKATYINILTSRGNLTLGNLDVTVAYTGEVEALQQFVYGTDFFLGDIVQVRNEFGLESYARVSEVVRSWDGSGYKVTPTFTKKEFK